MSLFLGCDGGCLTGLESFEREVPAERGLGLGVPERELEGLTSPGTGGNRRPGVRRTMPGLYSVSGKCSALGTLLLGVETELASRLDGDGR